MLTKTCKAVRYKQTIQVFKPNPDTKGVYLIQNNTDVLHKIPKEHLLIHSDKYKEKDMVNTFENIHFIRRWQHGDKILHKNKSTLIADLIAEYALAPHQKEYLYVGIHNPEKEIAFAFFCPNSVLLQLN
jgi:hypothetical protein